MRDYRSGYRPSRIQDITISPRTVKPQVAAARSVQRVLGFGTCGPSPQRQGDEFVCLCGRRWGVTEERPCGDS